MDLAIIAVLKILNGIMNAARFIEFLVFHIDLQTLEIDKKQNRLNLTLDDFVTSKISKIIRKLFFW